MESKGTNLKEIKDFNFKGIKEILNRDQMKQIKGGSGFFVCYAWGPTCAFLDDRQQASCPGFLFQC
ncbi:MAG: hypothetical protein JWQ57_4923 [Mucilaginibacter sp.]|nr:hypothetical protein [Mucilaginibacter sp.]